jgi:hypothetical protein
LTEAKKYGRITAVNHLISLEKTGYTTHTPNKSRTRGYESKPLPVGGQISLGLPDERSETNYLKGSPEFEIVDFAMNINKKLSATKNLFRK